MAAAQEERFTRKKHDAGFPSKAVEYCLKEGGITGLGARLRRLLREAARQVRAAARNLRGVGATRVEVVPDGHAVVAGREAVDGRRHCRPARGVRRPGAVRRASRVACLIGVLSVAVRKRRGRHHGRRRRMGHLVDRCRSRTRPRDPSRDALPAFARPAVFRVHLLHRLQGELRRIQGDGPRAVRRAEVRAADQGSPGPDQGRRQRLDEPGVLHLRARADHDRQQARVVDRQPGPPAGNAAHAARDGPRAIDPGHHRGGDVEDDRLRASRERHEGSLSRRRRRAQLRRQRPHPARGTVRADLDPAGCRRCRRRAWRRDEPVAPASREAADQSGGLRHMAAAAKGGGQNVEGAAARSTPMA